MFGAPTTTKASPSSNDHFQHISKKDNHQSPQPFKWLGLLLLLAGLIFAYDLYNSDKKLAPGLVETPEGEIALSPKRQAKLDRELEEIDDAVQYALIATVDGNYPCLSCPFGLKTVYLYKGNVWKYGTTRKDESERYPGGNYGANNLAFLPMFFGTYSECLKQEKTLIYNYPLLPEARAREVILARPPGNKYDT